MQEVSSLMRRLAWLSAAVVLAFCLRPASMSAQSLTTGAIAGSVTDPSGAVLAGVTVNAKSLDTGAVLTTTTSGAGNYRFTLLKPGRYEVSVSATGFAKLVQATTVEVGQITTADLTLRISKGAQTIEVTATTTALITATSGVNTTFSRTEVQELPNPGGDLTNLAQTAPGVVMNNTEGYGNFTVYGLPATSNLFTVNGENDMDPYFNINSSGATNLTIGSNEVQEVTVSTNSYAGQYGQLAGAQVTMITKSGSNQFHGNAQYWWNGRAMNANDWMNNNAGVPRPFSNANQWATSVGGPIKKDKTFFFADYEGVRFILPNTFNIDAPTPALASAVLANVTANQPNEVDTYKKFFDLYQGAAAEGSSPTMIPNNDYCNALVLPGFNPATQYCDQSFIRSASALGSEWVLGGRVDQKIGNNDSLYFRYRGDHGLQPTTIDPINANFNALSKQPAWDTQFNEIHILGPHATNSFMATLSHYVAQFQQDEQKALGTFPYQVVTSGSVTFTGFGGQMSFPQGRNITQYQFIDDFAWVHGNHSFKFGENFRRYDVSDHNFFYQNPGVYFGYVGAGLQQFVDGLAYQYRRAVNLSTNVPVAMWGLGLYAQDEWKATPHLTLTLSLRAEKNSNPVCQQNCFANFVGPWESLPSVKAGEGAGDVPYTQDIKSGLHQAFPGTDAVNLAPRFGFSWSPRSSNDLVISGGFGLFYDSAPAGLVDDLLENPPISTSLRVRPTHGTPAFDPTASGAAATWAASAQAFLSGFNAGQTYKQIKHDLSNLGVVFSAPAFNTITGTYHSPQWKEWNLQVQKQFGKSTVFTLNYVGNSGTNIPYSSEWANAYDPYGLYLGMLPYSAPVPNYANVTVWKSGAISNYNGLTLSLTERYSNWFTGHLNYTWSHNMDEGSNGGVFTYGDSLLGQNNPTSFRAGNYGNSDYDIRHMVTADYVLTTRFNFQNAFAKHLLRDWELAGKMYLRTGLPFSVEDYNTTGYVFNGGGTVFAQPLVGLPGAMNCGKRNATATADPNVPGCLSPVSFVDTSSMSWLGYTAFTDQARNQYRGPGFFDMDMSLFRYFNIKEKMKLAVGLTAFNAFNHPNFFNPSQYLLAGDTTFGQINYMTRVATSPYGTFLGFDSSPRVVQLSAKIQF